MGYQRRNGIAMPPGMPSMGGPNVLPPAAMPAGHMPIKASPMAPRMNDMKGIKSAVGKNSAPKPPKVPK